MAKLTVKRFSDLDEAKAFYLGEADRKAEAERSRYITPGNGQAMTYEAKHREALEGDGPLLRAEADALEMTVAEVAASVLAARAQWEEAGAQIEAARLKAKKQLRQAQTASEMHAVVREMSRSLDNLAVQS